MIKDIPKITYNIEKEDYEMICCSIPSLLLIQYGYPHPEQYDGISEYTCSNCGYRQGRWSGKKLVGEEHENRYGRQDK